MPYLAKRLHQVAREERLPSSDRIQHPVWNTKSSEYDTKESSILQLTTAVRELPIGALGSPQGIQEPYERALSLHVSWKMGP